MKACRLRDDACVPTLDEYRELVDALCSMGRMIGSAIGNAVTQAAEALCRGVRRIAD
jgi:hypothetical protein